MGVVGMGFVGGCGGADQILEKVNFIFKYETREVSSLFHGRGGLNGEKLRGLLLLFKAMQVYRIRFL